MSIIRIEGHEIETKEITKIIEVGWRKCGFEVHLVGPRVIKIQENEPYDMMPSGVARINDRYRKLREDVKAKWEADKSEVETFNL